MARKRNKERVGDILGLGDTSSPSAASSERITGSGSRSEEMHRRHRRMSEGADELTPEATTPPRRSGATGIDMGAGGEGTDLE